MKCETCKYREELNYSWLRDRPPESGSWAVCTRVIHWSSFDDDPVPARAYTQDASHYQSHLYVRSDFGCVEWESMG